MCSPNASFLNMMDTGKYDLLYAESSEFGVTLIKQKSPLWKGDITYSKNMVIPASMSFRDARWLMSVKKLVNHRS